MSDLLSLEEYKKIAIEETNKLYDELIANSEDNIIDTLKEAKEMTIKAINNEEERFMESFKLYCMSKAAKDLG